MEGFGKTYGEQIIEYEQNKALWNSINSIIDRTIILVGEIVLIIQLFKTEKNIGLILIAGIFMVCAQLDLLRVNK